MSIIYNICFCLILKLKIIIVNPHKDFIPPKYYKELMEVKNDVFSKILSIISKNNKSNLKI